MKWNSFKAKALLAAASLYSTVAMASPDLGEAEQQATNWHAIIMFIIFVGFTLFITKWAAKQTQSAQDFYTAGGGISGFQNGLAIAGDYMSAASFLGISAMVFSSGFDGLLYSLGFMVGWPIVLFLVAERLRNLGKYNLSDVVSFRLEEKPVRTLAAFSSLVVVAFYLIAQMVGAGQLIKLLFGLNYNIAVVIVGLLMMAYVVVVATGFIGYFYLLTFIIGFGAILFVSNNPQFLDVAKMAMTGKLELVGGNNMAAVHLSDALGGDLFMGFISAVAFATILAVVAGLTLSGASAISHDLYANVFKKGQTTPASELRMSKIATLGLAIFAMILGILFEKQNVAFMVGLAFSVACCANFPILVLSMFWKGLTTRGAVIGGVVGLVTAVVLIILSKAVWVDTLKISDTPINPFNGPALFAMPLSFLCCWFFSVTDSSARAKKERASFDAQYVRSMTGIGASGASDH
ncbi:sodium:solute symporter family transporter [Acinetobacter baumannii]|uniref:sodium:solute symporter family transporter n=1 Tax=Acinetobacter baumannii TaxID=470 RepID=UPI00132FA7E9|nr:hypothetical protein [Acinetobacter baumannii]KAF0599469.1 hypothetical protein AB71190_03485 [Acinetobacter baumannii]